MLVGSYLLTAKATDNQGAAATSAPVSITVVGPTNHPPAISPIDPQRIDEGVRLAFLVQANDPDVPAQLLTYSLATNVPPGASIQSTTGLFTWTPTEAQGPSTNVITVGVADNGNPSLSTTTNFTVIVNEVNLPPVLAAIPDQTVRVGEIIRIQATATDSDIPANALTFSLAAGALTGASIDANTGVFTWTPNTAQASGTNRVTVRVTDNDSPPLSDEKSFSIFVQDNARPTVALINPVNGATFTAPAGITIRAEAGDSDGSIASVEFFQGSTKLGESRNSPYQMLWTNVLAGSYSLTARATDNQGATAISASVSITVMGPTNRPPAISPISPQRIDEDVRLSFLVLANDPDGPAQVLTYSLATNAPPGASIQPTLGLFTWTPTEAQGPSTNVFTVRVADNGNPSLSVTTNFTVIVSEVNLPPVLAAIVDRTIRTGETLTVQASATDDDLPTNRLTFSLDTGAPAGANFDPNTGVFTWTPTTAQSPSTNRITVRVTDNGSPPLSDTKSFVVLIQPPVIEELVLPKGDILIIRNFPAPEIDRLAEFLTNSAVGIRDLLDGTIRKPPTMVVTGKDGLELKHLAAFRLLVWDDLGQAEQGLRDRDVELFWQAWKFGLPIYFIGEGLDLAKVPLSEAARRMWSDLTGLSPADTRIGPGRIVRQEPVERVNELFRGMLPDVDLVKDFDYPQSLSIGKLIGNGEVRATLAGAPALIRYPHFNASAETGARRLVQNFLVTPGTAESVEERRKLFLNGVVWLLGGECDNFATSSDCSSLARAPIQNLCQPFKLNAVISNNGRCDAGGMVVTNLVPEGWDILATIIRSTPAGVNGGFVERQGRTVIYGIGKVGTESTVEVETWVMARSPGLFTNKFTFRSNFRPPEECTAVIRVEGGNCACPRLEIASTRTGLVLTIRNGCPIGAVLQVSSNLIDWTNYRTNPAAVEITIPVDALVGDRMRFFRVVPSIAAAVE